jgi:hypothetical protein
MSLNLCRFATIAMVAAGIGQAAVPPDVAAKLREMGRGVCVPGTALLYKPMQLKPPAGVKIDRDIKYADDARTVLDVAMGEKGGGSRPVLIYVSGGAGNKMEPVPEGDPFYDNILYFAVNNGMVGVNVQRRAFPAGSPFDAPAKDIATVVQWVQTNAKKYKGNPDRVFIWSHSAGNPPVATYLGHPELYGPKGVGVKGAILMAPAPFNITPVVVPPTPPAPAEPVIGNGAGCQGPTDAGRGAGGGRGGPGGGGAAKGGPGGGDGKGKGGGFGGGDAKAGDGKGGAPGGGRGGGRGAPDPAAQLAQSDLPGLLKLKIGFFFAAGDLDPLNMPVFLQTVKEQLCKNGKSCPTMVMFKDHSHVSEVFSPNTADDSVTGPILKWMKSVK